MSCCRHLGGRIDPELAELLANVRFWSRILLSAGLWFVWPFGVWSPRQMTNATQWFWIESWKHTVKQHMNRRLVDGNSAYFTPCCTCLTFHQGELILHWTSNSRRHGSFWKVDWGDFVSESFRWEYDESLMRVPPFHDLGSSHSARVLKEHWLPGCLVLNSSRPACYGASWGGCSWHPSCLWKGCQFGNVMGDVDVPRTCAHAWDLVRPVAVWRDTVTWNCKAAFKKSCWRKSKSALKT